MDIIQRRKACIEKCRHQIAIREPAHHQQFIDSLIEAAHLGISDVVSQLISQYFVFAYQNNLDLFYFLELSDTLVRHNYFMPPNFVRLLQMCFQKFYNLQEKNNIQRYIGLLKSWSSLNPPLAQNLKISFEYIVKRNLQVKFGSNPRIKSKREISQQTDIPFNPTKRVKIQGEIRQSESKQIKKEDNAMTRYQNMLKKIRGSYNFVCKECGKHFSIKDNYQQHKKEHFDEKLAEFKEKKSRKIQKPKKIIKKMKTAEQWSMENEVEKTENSVMRASIEDAEICIICKCKIDTYFNNDQWRYQNSLQVKTSEGYYKGYSHRDCYLSLQRQ